MTDQTKSDVIEIEDIHQFVAMTSAWHGEKVRALEHMLKVPDGTEMIIDGDKPVTLTGDLLLGFVAGLQLGLMELGTLPFFTSEGAAPEPALAAVVDGP